MRISNDGLSLYFTDGGSLFSKINTSNGNFLQLFTTYGTTDLYAVAVSPNSSYVMIGGSDQTSSIYKGCFMLINATTYSSIKSYYSAILGNQYVPRVDFIDDNNYIVLSSSFGTEIASETLFKMTLGTDGR